MSRCRARFLSCFLLLTAALAQDASTGAIRGTVSDQAGGRIPGATVALVNNATGLRYSNSTDTEGRFVLQLLPPGDYSGRALSPGMSPQITPPLHVEIGGTLQVEFKLAVAGSRETVTVSDEPALVETQPAAVSAVIDERAISELPLNGRRFTDLALLAPGVTQDPRGLTSASNGDLAFGGIRGYQSSFLVITTTASSPKPVAAIALPTNFPTKWCRSFVFPPTPTARNWDARAARW